MLDLSQETEALARRLAVAQRLSVDDAIRVALEERARSTGLAEETREPQGRSPAEIAARREQIDHLVAEINALPVLDPRSTEEIVDDINAL
jgi:antitoxin VapB